jgi:small subunit ribosomal protein S6
MKHYELLFVIKPTLTQEETVAKFDFIKEVMEKNNCEIKTVKDMGVRKLAYEIEKFERGHYFVVYYTTTPDSLEEILRNLRLTEEIIRFLNVKFEKKKEIAQWDKLVKAASAKKEEKPTPTPTPTPKVEEKLVATPKAEEKVVEKEPEDAENVAKSAE